MHLAVFFIDVRLCVDTDIESYISALIYKIARWKPRWLVGNKNIYIYLYIYIYVTLSLNRARRKSMEPSKAYCGWKHMTMVIPQYKYAYIHSYIHVCLYTYINIHMCVHYTYTPAHGEGTGSAGHRAPSHPCAAPCQYTAGVYIYIYKYLYMFMMICIWIHIHIYSYMHR